MTVVINKSMEYDLYIEMIKREIPELYDHVNERFFGNNGFTTTLIGWATGNLLVDAIVQEIGILDTVFEMRDSYNLEKFEYVYEYISNNRELILCKIL